MKKVSTLILFLFVCGTMPLIAFSQEQSSIVNLIKRVLPNHYNQIVTQIIPKDGANDVFEIGTANGKIVLRGNNAISIASALNWYLKYYCHVQESWCGDNMKLPSKLPHVKDKIHISSPYKDRVYLNYCTFNYSMAWWDWKRWEKEIDWMAMHSINMPLAVTGQEAAWQNTLRKYGMNDNEIRSFLVGPAYLAWQWMTNIEGVFGPLPQDWIDRSIKLGKKILKRERELGMTPILQGFTGYVPIKLIEKQPQASILRKPVWYYVGQGTAQLDPLDPLFAKMNRTFLEAQTKLFGTDHIYAADPFHEGTPPVKGDKYLSDVGKVIYKTTVAVDSLAIIAMQTWSMRKPIVESIPDDRIIMLDLNSARWKSSEAFWGKPWVAGIIHNFGGNTFLGGNLDSIISRFPSLLHNPASKQLQGIGLFPEAIEQNPIIYEAAAEMAWYNKKPKTRQWMYDYLLARYGHLDEKIKAGWDILLHTVYGKQVGLEPFMESAICARPALKINGASPNGALNSEKNYRFKDLWEAVSLFQNCSPLIKQTDTYKYDLVDLMRQCLADLSIPIQRDLAESYLNNHPDSFNYNAKLFIDLMKDFNELLGTRKEFLLGRWIADARVIGQTKAEKDLYEKNARSLITIWGPYNPQAIQYDYSARQWNGMISDFYLPRWEMFIDFLKAELQKDAARRYKEIDINNKFNRPANDANDFYKMISKWESTWTDSHNTNLPTKPKGDEIEVVKKLYEKWQKIAEKEFTTI